MRRPVIVLAASILAACGSDSGMPVSQQTGDREHRMTSPQLPVLDIPRLFAAPDLDGSLPRVVRISPDSSRVTFLRAKDTDPLKMDLWEYSLTDRAVRLLVDSTELVAGGETLSEEELARRERLRIVGQSGIVSYQFSPDGEMLLFPLAGDLFLYDIGRRETRRLTATAAGETDPQFSATGRYVSFIRDQDLFLIDLETADERRLTMDGGGVIRNGMAEFIAQEEMDRYTGYWWAPDDSAVAFIRVDESGVEVAERFEVYAEEVKVFRQRYPATGTPNARVRLGVISPDGEGLRWMDIGMDEDIYLPRVDWFPGAGFLAVQRQARDQKTLELLKVNVASGESHVLLTETSDTWINLHNDLRFLESRSQFIWNSERSGHAHLYLYGNDGDLVRPLTGGDWDVVDGARDRSALLHVDETQQRVFFTATLDSPIERNVYSVSYTSPAAPERVSQANGWHKAVFAENGEFYVDDYQSAKTPPQLSLHHVDGSRIAFIEENRLDASHPYQPYLATRPSIEFGTLVDETGETLHFRILRPAEIDAGERSAAIVSVYGGPHGQRVTDTWSADFDEVLARNGFVVFSIDNRGTGFRGTGFDAPIHRRMGEVEVAGQMVGVNYLRSLDFVDADRIGVWGWSYGGYMTLMCLFKEPAAFAAGVSGAPVTDWTLYDTHYTERYLGMPQENPEGYVASSVFPYAKNLEAPLLIVHGMADDNVLFTNSTRLFSVLQDQGLPFEMMTYPGGKHALTRVPSTGQHAYTQILRFFTRHLQE